MSDKKKKVRKTLPEERYNSLIRYKTRRVLKRREAEASMDNRIKQVTLEILENNFTREQIAIELSRKNQKQANSWVV